MGIDFKLGNSIDLKSGELSNNLFFTYPFISIQIDFGYSDATPKNNAKNRVDDLFKKSQSNVEAIKKVLTYFESTENQNEFNITAIRILLLLLILLICQKEQIEKHITYIRTGEGWLYLTVVMDLVDRKIIGWSMDNIMSAGTTVVDDWKIAIKNRPVDRKLIFHSDQGIQYASHEFRKCLKGLLVLQRMSRKGNCWDNAIAESFFKTLKTEMVYHRKFQTRAQAKLEIFDCIEVWYNRKRSHSALDYLAPVQVETAMLKNKKEAA